jgi:GINS complex subunit 2
VSLVIYQGTIGPIKPNEQITVPLWLAIKLRRSGKCKIVIPDWLRAHHLRAYLESEKTERTFTQLPAYFISISLQLLKFAAQDFPDNEQHTAKQLLYDLQAVRSDKINNGIMTGLMQQEGAVIGYQMNNITSSEIQKIRKMTNLLLTKLNKISTE